MKSRNDLLIKSVSGNKQDRRFLTRLCHHTYYIFSPDKNSVKKGFFINKLNLKLLRDYFVTEPLLNLILFNTIFWVLFSLIFGEVNTKYTFYISILFALGILLSRPINPLNLFKIHKEFIFYPFVIITIIFVYFKKIVELKTPSDSIMRNIAINTFRESDIASLTNQYKFPDGSLNYWYSLSTEFYPDAIHILIAQLGNVSKINNENLTLILFLYGIFIIWPYLIFKILSYNKYLSYKNKVILTFLFGSLNIFPLSTLAWGGLPFLYGQLLALYLVQIYVNKNSSKFFTLLLSPFLFFIHPSGVATFLLTVFTIFILKNKTFTFLLKSKFIIIVSIILVIFIIIISFTLISDLIDSQSAPSLYTNKLFSISTPTKILNFFATYFIFGSITNHTLFGLTSFQYYTFPTALALFFVYRKIFRLNVKRYLLLLIPLSLMVTTQVVGLDNSLLHNIGQFFTFPWNSHPSRLYPVFLICLVAFIPFLRTNFYLSNSYQKYLFPIVSLNFLYVNLITFYAYGH